MPGFDPYDRGRGGLDLDQLLNGFLTLLHIATALFGAVLLVVAFVFALRVFDVVENFVAHPDRMAEYVRIIRANDKLLPPVEELSSEPGNPSLPTNEQTAVAAAPARAASWNDPDVFDRMADRVLVVLIMAVYAIVPIGMALVGLKIVVAMISRKTTKRTLPEADKDEEDREPAPDAGDAGLPRRIG